LTDQALKIHHQISNITKNLDLRMSESLSSLSVLPIPISVAHEFLYSFGLRIIILSQVLWLLFEMPISAASIEQGKTRIGVNLLDHSSHRNGDPDSPQLSDTSLK
jgi:hypothetical protein